MLRRSWMGQRTGRRLLPLLSTDAMSKLCSDRAQIMKMTRLFGNASLCKATGNMRMSTNRRLLRTPSEPAFEPCAETVQLHIPKVTVSAKDLAASA